MHYANGRTARIGDIVRGKGYNIKHEIIGKLVAARAGQDTCNCTVAAVTDISPALVMLPPGGSFESGVTPYVSEVRATMEYGQLDAFVALDPKTGEVLPSDQLESFQDVWPKEPPAENIPQALSGEQYPNLNEADLADEVSTATARFLLTSGQPDGEGARVAAFGQPINFGLLGRVPARGDGLHIRVGAAKPTGRQSGAPPLPEWAVEVEFDTDYRLDAVERTLRYLSRHGYVAPPEWQK